MFYSGVFLKEAGFAIGPKGSRVLLWNEWSLKWWENPLSKGVETVVSCTSYRDTWRLTCFVLFLICNVPHRLIFDPLFTWWQ